MLNNLKKSVKREVTTETINIYHPPSLLTDSDIPADFKRVLFVRSSVDHRQKPCGLEEKLLNFWRGRVENH